VGRHAVLYSHLPLPPAHPSLAHHTLARTQVYGSKGASMIENTLTAMWGATAGATLNPHSLRPMVSGCGNLSSSRASFVHTWSSRASCVHMGAGNVSSAFKVSTLERARAGSLYTERTLCSCGLAMHMERTLCRVSGLEVPGDTHSCVCMKVYLEGLFVSCRYASGAYAYVLQAARACAGGMDRSAEREALCDEV
jgi:hypothetical protein